jgi:hypothetical protein
MSQTIEQILTKFGVVTVMEAKFFPAEQGLTYDSNGVVEQLPLFELDTLSISNFTQEGPVKMSKGGLNAEVVFRYGKTARLEMEDVVGRISALTNLMGVRERDTNATIVKTATQKFIAAAGQTEFLLDFPVKIVDNNPVFTVKIEDNNGEMIPSTDFTVVNRLLTYDLGQDPALTEGQIVEIVYDYDGANTAGYFVTDRFSGYYQIVGRTFVVNEGTGAREYVNFIVNKFLPDSLFNLSMEAEGDLAVFNLAGEIFTDDCGIFYEITKSGQGSCGAIAPL